MLKLVTCASHERFHLFSYDKDGKLNNGLCGLMQQYSKSFVYF